MRDEKLTNNKIQTPTIRILQLQDAGCGLWDETILTKDSLLQLAKSTQIMHKLKNSTKLNHINHDKLYGAPENDLRNFEQLPLYVKLGLPCFG